ncbi:MAG TPA: DNA gyrase modulator, partial [Acidimicrobiales bacterium]
MDDSPRTPERMVTLVPEDVMERVLGTALNTGGDFAEVFAEDRQAGSATLDDGKVEELSSSRDRGAGIRVVTGETTGFAHTADLTEEGRRGPLVLGEHLREVAARLQRGTQDPGDHGVIDHGQPFHR